jgi:uncharacterized membrane protein
MSANLNLLKKQGCTSCSQEYAAGSVSITNTLVPGIAAVIALILASRYWPGFPKVDIMTGTMVVVVVFLSGVLLEALKL